MATTSSRPQASTRNEKGARYGSLSGWGGLDDGRLPLDFNDFEVAAKESQGAYEAHRLWSFIRHARIPRERGTEFWAQAMALVHEFDRLPRGGDTTFGFVVGLYPISDYPMLPEPEE